MKPHVDAWLHSIQQALIPACCVICLAGTDLEADICRHCHADLPRLKRQCRHCALPLALAADSNVCPTCVRRPLFDHAFAGFYYHSPISWLISGLKYRRQVSHARLIGWLLAQQMHQYELPRPDLLVPMPLHPTAFRRRGFNQAELMARYLVKRLNWPLSEDHFIRIRDTPRQSRLKADQRRANVRHAFRAQKSVQGLHITLLDDVMTTASTAQALANCARRDGATRVDVVCLARA